MSLTGVEMVWILAPPSDQDWNTLPPCGEGASIVRWMPSTPTTADGAVNVCPSSLSWSRRRVVKVIVVVRGSTSRKASWVRPTESMTDRWIRYQTFAAVSPIVGTVKDHP